MQEELRDRIADYLSQYQLCVISTIGAYGEWAILAQYKNEGLDLICNLPRWSDTLYFLEQDPHVMVIIQATQPDHLHWVQYRGVASRLDSTRSDRFVSVRICPTRIDLLDECSGWDARETLDL